MDPSSTDSDSGKRGSAASLVRHSLVYSLVPITTRVVSILMIPLYTAWLVEAEYGVKEILDLVLTAFSYMLGANLLAGMMRFYFDQPTEDDANSVVSSSILAVTVLSWIPCGIALIFHRQLAPILLGRGDQFVPPEELASLLALALVVLPIQLIAACGYQYVLILQRSGLYSTVLIAKLVIEVALQILLIGFLGLGVRGFLFSVLIGDGLAGVGLTAWALWEVKPRFRWRVLKPIVRFSAPLVPVLLFQLGMHQIDRRLLEALAPEAVALTWVGIYGLGYKMGYLVNLTVLSPFMRIWQPWIFGIEQPEERAALIAKVTTYLVLVVSVGTILVSMFARQMIVLLTSREGYEMAYQVVPWIAGAYVLWSIYFASEVPLLVEKRTTVLLWINLAALIGNAALNFVLVPVHGYIGSAMATVITFALLALLGLWACHSVTSVVFEVGRLSGTLLITGLSCAGAAWIDSQTGSWTLLSAVLLKLLVSLAALIGLWFAILTGNERREFLYRARAALVKSSAPLR